MTTTGQPAGAGAPAPSGAQAPRYADPQARATRVSVPALQDRKSVV